MDLAKAHCLRKVLQPEEVPVCTSVESASVLYQQACLAVEAGQADLAESYYLQSLGCYEKFGGAHLLNVANASNALAFLRKGRGDREGALAAAKQSLQVLAGYRVQSADADFVRSTAWELIEMLNEELS